MSSSNYRKWDESQSPQWKYLLQKDSMKRKQARRNTPARMRGKQNYDSALDEAKKIRNEKKARTEEINKLLREEKERNTVYR